MKPKLTYFYHKGCHNCKALTPLINEIYTPLNIKVINTYSDDVLLDENLIKFVPTLMIEDKNGKHLFEGPNEVKEALKKLIK